MINRYHVNNELSAISMCQGTLDIKCITYKYQSCITHAISSLLCRINRRHQIISLKTRIYRSGSKGLRSDCICICGLLWLSCDLWWWFIMNCDDGLLWIVMLVYCELWWWFIMPMTYNYTCDDALLWIVMVYCELRGVRCTGQISKKGVLVALPSVTLGKETLYRVSIQNTRRRDQFLLFWESFLLSVLSLPSISKWTLGKAIIKICPLRACLPSVLRATLGKVCNLCRVL